MGEYMQIIGWNMTNYKDLKPNKSNKTNKTDGKSDKIRDVYETPGFYSIIFPVYNYKETR